MAIRNEKSEEHSVLLVLFAYKQVCITASTQEGGQGKPCPAGDPVPSGKARKEAKGKVLDAEEFGYPIGGGKQKRQGSSGKVSYGHDTQSW